MQKAVIIVAMIALVILTVWDCWTALHGYVMDGNDVRRRI
jgi:hypothetical protein